MVGKYDRSMSQQNTSHSAPLTISLRNVLVLFWTGLTAVAPCYLAAAPLNIDLSLANLPHANTQRGSRYSPHKQLHYELNLHVRLADKFIGSSCLSVSDNIYCHWMHENMR